MLDDRQIIAIDLYIKGYKVTEISKEVGVSRQAIYDWLKKDEFKAEADRRLALIKSDAKNKISSKVDTYIGELEKIALNGNSEKTRTDALTYLIDHVIGKPTAKLEDVTTNKDNENSELSWDDAKKLDNVIELDKKVK